MTSDSPFPDLDELLMMIGEAGHRMSKLDATEGAAGNISVYAGWGIEPRRKFLVVETISLPEPVPIFVWSCTSSRRT